MLYDFGGTIIEIRLFVSLKQDFGRKKNPCRVYAFAREMQMLILRDLSHDSSGYFLIFFTQRRTIQLATIFKMRAPGSKRKVVQFWRQSDLYIKSAKKQVISKIKS